MRGLSKVRLAIVLTTPATPEQLDKANAFILAAKAKIQRTQNVQIVIVSLLDGPHVVYNPHTKESYYVA